MAPDAACQPQTQLSLRLLLSPRPRKHAEYGREAAAALGQLGAEGMCFAPNANPQMCFHVMVPLTVIMQMAANCVAYHIHEAVIRAMWALSRHLRNVLKRMVNGNIGKSALQALFEDLPWSAKQDLRKEAFDKLYSQARSDLTRLLHQNDDTKRNEVRALFDLATKHDVSLSKKHRDAKESGKRNPAPQKPRKDPVKGKRVQPIKEGSSAHEAMQDGALTKALAEGMWLHHVSCDKPNPKGAFLLLDTDQGEQYLQRLAVARNAEPLLFVAEFEPTAEMERYMPSTPFFLPVERKGHTSFVQAVYWQVGEKPLPLPEQPPKVDITPILAETVNLTMPIHQRFCTQALWKEAHAAFQSSKNAFRDLAHSMLKKKTEPLALQMKTSTVLDVWSPRLFGKDDHQVLSVLFKAPQDHERHVWRHSGCMESSLSMRT